MRKLAVVLVIPALLAGGCGGGGGHGRLGRADFVAKADAICRDLVAEQKALEVPAGIAGIPAYIDRALPLLDGAVERVRALRPPADLEQGVADWLAAVGESRAALTGMRAAAERGDRAQVRTIGARGIVANRRSDALAGAIGLTACATA
jgi:hypothetical protein